MLRLNRGLPKMNPIKIISCLFILCYHTVALSAPVSLKEKIGQMLIIGFEGNTVTAKSPIIKAIQQQQIGGVILFDYNAKTKQFDKNIESPAQVRELNNTLQTANTDAQAQHHRQPLPLLISVDYEGGRVNRLREEYGFPATYSAKTLGKMPLYQVFSIAQTMAETLKSNHFNLDFAPVLDVEVNPNNPVIAQLERSFSADPIMVTKNAEAFSKAFSSKKIACAYKHFPGHGSSSSDSHQGFVDVSDSWSEQELLPYQELINQPDHCGLIMTAHIVNRNLDPSGLPATLSQPILTGLLRQNLQYDGVIITDDMQMKAITDHYGLEKAITLAINAGADMLMFGNQLVEKPQDPQTIIHIIEQKVASGEIAPERIEDAYQHIVRLKKTLDISAQS